MAAQTAVQVEAWDFLSNKRYTKAFETLEGYSNWKNLPVISVVTVEQCIVDWHNGPIPGHGAVCGKTLQVFLSMLRTYFTIKLKSNILEKSKTVAIQKILTKWQDEEVTKKAKVVLSSIVLTDCSHSPRSHLSERVCLGTALLEGRT